MLMTSEFKEYFLDKFYRQSSTKMNHLIVLGYQGSTDPLWNHLGMSENPIF